MGQVQLVRSNGMSRGFPEAHYGRYTRLRLDEAYKYAVDELFHTERITSHLSKLIRKMPGADTAFLFLSLKQDLLLAKAGCMGEETMLRKSDEQVFFSNIPIKTKHTYFQPVVINDHIVGYLSIGFTQQASSEILLREIAEAYSVVMATELEMAEQQIQLDVKQTQLAAKEEKLKKSQEYNQKLLSLTSHDLASPLSAISGYVDLIGNYIEKDDRQQTPLQEYYRRIDLGLSEVMGMLKQCSDLSKIESGKIHLNMVDVSINWPVQKVCCLLESKAIKKGIDFTVELSDRPLFVKVDIVKLKRIVYNLVSNAIKYTPEGGGVIIKTGTVANEVRLVIKDTGMGIKKTDQPKIFAPSVKLNEADSNSLSSGLGLYIASFFADLMNGAISVASKLHEGSLFTVKLPLMRAPNWNK